MRNVRFLRAVFLVFVLFVSPACAAEVRADVSLGTALSAGKGSTVSVPAYVKAAEEVAIDGLSLQVSYDPKVLSFVRMDVESSAFPQKLQQTDDVEKGIVTVAVGALENFPKGSFRACTLVFNCVSAGTTSLELQTEGDFATMATSGGESVTGDVAGMTVTVR